MGNIRSLVFETAPASRAAFAASGLHSHKAIDDAGSERAPRLGALEDAVFAERTRLAMDLHDGLLQSLAAIRFRLHAAKAEKGPRQAASIDCALEVIAREQQTLRAFVEDLSSHTPHEDEPAAWPVARIADGLVRVAQAWDCRLDLRFSPAHFFLPQQYAEQIGMLLREAVSNAVRHARAKRLFIEVARRPGLIRIIFEERSPAPKALTASRSRSLEARVAALNGSMSLYAATDARTTVFVIPTHAF